MQFSDIAKTKTVLDAMKKVAGGEGSTTLLAQLVDLIQNQVADLQKKGDMDTLAKTKKAFKNLLNDLDKAQTKKSGEVAYLLAKNYSSIDEHEKAADVLVQVEPPMPTGMKDVDGAATTGFITLFASPTYTSFA